MLRTGLTSDDAFLRRFRAEAVAVAGLNHPHVLRVFDWGEADGEAWLVTEYLSGGSLRDLLDEPSAGSRPSRPSRSAPRPRTASPTPTRAGSSTAT